MDSEFESVATQLLKRTQAMLNKYRCLLIEDAMVRCRTWVHSVYGMGFNLLKIPTEQEHELLFPASALLLQ